MDVAQERGVSSVAVWYAIPSAAPVEMARSCLAAWREQGYRVAVARERDDLLKDIVDLHLQPPYQGYQRTVNMLCRSILSRYPSVEVVVTGGDDVFPDRSKDAQLIAREFVEHFGGTLGVMQPTGHSDWSVKARRIAWSPWLGREWCERAYDGRGPFPEGYHHLRADIELCEVAKRLGVWWERPDLAQRHERHAFASPHLTHVAAHAQADAALFDARRTAGYPGSGLAAG